MALRTALQSAPTGATCPGYTKPRHPAQARSLVPGGAAEIVQHPDFLPDPVTTRRRKLTLILPLRLRMQEGGFLGLGRVAAPGVVAPKRLVAQKSSE